MTLEQFHKNETVEVRDATLPTLPEFVSDPPLTADPSSFFKKYFSNSMELISILNLQYQLICLIIISLSSLLLREIGK
jgi:hypothetical protein